MIHKFLRRLSNLKKVKQVELGDQFVKSCTIGLKGFITEKDRPSTTKIEIDKSKPFHLRITFVLENKIVLKRTWLKT